MADFVNTGDDPADIAGAINYLLANTLFRAPPNLVVNPDGTVTNKDGTDIEYLYPNLNIVYADNPQGLNFSSLPVNRQYFGIRNTSITSPSTNPLDYSWTEVTGGFGTTKYLYYATTGGRQVKFKISSSEGVYWERVPIGPLSLDSVTAVYEKLQLLAPSAAIRPLITGGYDTTSTATLYCTATFANGNVTTLSVVASTDAYGRLSVAIPAVLNDFTVTTVGINTNEVAVTFTNKIGSITGYFYSGTAMGFTDGSFTYPLQYLILRYATNNTGSDISVNPIGKTYIGLMNNISATTTENPANFTWYPLGNTLSASNTVYVKNNGNRSILFSVGNEPPDSAVWTDVKLLNTLNPNLDLDSRTGFVITRGFEESGNYRTLPVETPDGALTFSLPSIYNGSASINPQTVTNIQVDFQGRIVGITLFDTLAVRAVLFQAPSPAASFAFPHVLGQMLLFRNGVLQRPTSDYTETTADFTLVQYTVGDSLIAWRFTSQQNSPPIGPLVPFTNYQTVTTPNQNRYTFAGLETGSELLFVNGVFLRDSDYDYDGNSIVLSFYPSTGCNLRAVSFRKFNGNFIPITQLLGQTTANVPTVTFTKGTVITDYTMLHRNGVAMRNVSDFTTTNTGASGGQLTFGVNPRVSGDLLELTNFSASGLAASASGASGASASNGKFVGQKQVDGSTLKSIGEADPSVSGRFDTFTPQATISEQFAELNAIVETLKQQVIDLQNRSI